MKEKIKAICAIILFFISFAAVLYAIIMQFVLSFEYYGVIITRNIIIPHLSLLGLLGIIPMYLVGYWYYSL